MIADVDQSSYGLGGPIRCTSSQYPAATEAEVLLPFAGIVPLRTPILEDEAQFETQDRTVQSCPPRPSHHRIIRSSKLQYYP